LKEVVLCQTKLITTHKQDKNNNRNNKQ